MKNVGHAESVTYNFLIHHTFPNMTIIIIFVKSDTFTSP